jgi:cobalamin biosynthesis protein CobW
MQKTEQGPQKDPNFKKLPMTVLTGFLGAGKTTLLNYILTNNQGLNIGVVVNDYGDINVDSDLIADKTDAKLELTNGCICCSLETLDLQEAIGQFAYQGSPIDYIIIEASGLAEPKDLALTLKDTIGQRVYLDSIVTVLDAENLEKNAQEHGTATEQIEFCDFVIINKVDLVPEAKVKDIRNLIGSINPKARILEATKGEVEIHLLLDQDVFAKRDAKPAGDHVHDGDEHSHHADHVHSHYQTFSFTSDKPLHPMRFQEFVNKQIPTSIYRAKGFVDLGTKGHERKYIFQLVGTRAEITWSNWGGDAAQTRLVFIGQDADQAKIMDALQECVDEAPEEPLDGIEVQLPKKAQ